MKPGDSAAAHSVEAVRAARYHLITAAIGVLLLGSGCASDTDDPSPAASAAAPPSALVDPDVFARRIDAAGVVTINVHIPNEGSIAGTDLTVPFDQIATSTELPADRATPLAVYCRSGTMSATAVEDLTALGYTDVVELDGGFNAWKRAGRLLQPA